ncbi:MAG: UPF0280 family protein [Prolixibacteraceae bacterium]|nr:UPF0280 family protein [Prolixibacteraceae bacterium]
MEKKEPRFYRDGMGEGRFRSFVVGYKDSDLWIGIDVQSFRLEMANFAQQKLIEFRQQLEAYIQNNVEFVGSLSPLELDLSAPDIAQFMCNASMKAGTGPMAAVAGAFSEYIGKALLEKYAIKELVVENGGDLFLSLQKAMQLSVYAGDSSLSNKVGVEIPAEDTPIGVCTSAGTVGPSISFGKADAVMIISKNTGIADAFATAIGNKVKTAADIESQLEIIDDTSEIISGIIICDGRLGIKGKYDLKLIQHK